MAFRRSRSARSRSSRNRKQAAPEPPTVDTAEESGTGFTVSMPGPRVHLGAPTVDMGDVQVDIGEPRITLGNARLHLGDPEVSFRGVRLELAEPKIELGAPTIRMGQPQLTMGSATLRPGRASVKVAGNPAVTMGSTTVSMGAPRVSMAMADGHRAGYNAGDCRGYDYGCEYDACCDDCGDAGRYEGHYEDAGHYTGASSTMYRSHPAGVSSPRSGRPRRAAAGVDRRYFSRGLDASCGHYWQTKPGHAASHGEYHVPPYAIDVPCSATPHKDRPLHSHRRLKQLKARHAHTIA